MNRKKIKIYYCRNKITDTIQKFSPHTNHFPAKIRKFWKFHPPPITKLTLTNFMTDVILRDVYWNTLNTTQSVCFWTKERCEAIGPHLVLYSYITVQPRSTRPERGRTRFSHWPANVPNVQAHVGMPTPQTSIDYRRAEDELDAHAVPSIETIIFGFFLKIEFPLQLITTALDNITFVTKNGKTKYCCIKYHWYLALQCL